MTKKNTSSQLLSASGASAWNDLQLQNELIAMSHDAIFVRDTQHVIRSWSNGAEDLFGWQNSQAIGHTAHSLFKTHFSYVDSSIEHSLHQTGRWEGDIIYTRKDGSEVIVSSRQSLLRDAEGHPYAILEVDQDVTVSKQTEQALQEQLQLAMVARDIGVWRWDIRGNRSAMLSNDTVGLFGLPSGKIYTYEEIMRVIHPDDRARVDLAVTEAIAQHKDYISEYRVIWPDESIRWIAARGRPLYDENDQPTQMVGISTDITARKRDEETLRKAHKKISAILESITDAFVQIDRNGHIIYMNQQAEMTFNMSRRDVLGYKLWDVLPHLQDTPLVDKVREAIEKDQLVQFESMMDRSQRWFAVKIYPSDGGVAIYYNDVTEYKKTERALRLSEAKFRRLADSNMLGVMVADKYGTVLEANDAFLEIVGYTQDDLEAHILNWQKMTPPEYTDADTLATKELIIHGVCKPYEKEFYSKDKRRIPILIAAARLTESNGRTICTVIDMTVQKQLEKQKETFMSIIGHELRTPLTAINGSIQLAQRRIQKFTESTHDKVVLPEVETILDKLSKLLEQSLRQTRVQNRMINDLLDISRLAIDKLELALQPTDLISIVREIVEDLRYTESGHDIELRIPDLPSIPVTVDPDRIEQVIANYVSNAIKYSPPQSPIVVEMEHDGLNARVWVRDHGPGLSQEAQEHIWDRFYRVSGVKDQQGSGVNLGLGLHICQVLIQRHHGEVGVVSELGHGSSFWFSLPLDQSKDIL